MSKAVRIARHWQSFEPEAVTATVIGSITPTMEMPYVLAGLASVENCGAKCLMWDSCIVHKQLPHITTTKFLKVNVPQRLCP